MLGAQQDMPLSAALEQGAQQAFFSLTVFSNAMLAVPPGLMLVFKHFLEGLLVWVKDFDTSSRDDL